MSAIAVKPLYFVHADTYNMYEACVNLVPVVLTDRLVVNEITEVIATADDVTHINDIFLITMCMGFVLI